MQLESPYFLLLLPLLVFWWKILHSPKEHTIFSQEIFEKLLVEKKSASQQPKMFLAALILMVIALARPTLHVNKEAAIQTHVTSTLAIAIDISNSMLARDIYPSRLDFSKVAVQKIFEKLDGFKFALLAFSNDGFLVAPFSEDRVSLNFLLKHLSTETLSSEGSSIPSAILSAQKIFAPLKEGNKELLIITDGADGDKIEEAIALANDEQIHVYLLLVGTTQGTMIYTAKGEALKDQKGNIVITKRADSMKELALKTGGAYVTTSGDLSEIPWLSEKIALKASKQSVQKEQPYEAIELFYYFLGMALMLLFFAFHALHVKRLMPLIMLLLGTSPAYSGILDWWEIEQAKNAYEKGSYDKSVRLYENVKASKQSDASAYNLANALYKAKQYEQALHLYEGIQDETLQRQVLHNQGNSLAQLGRIDDAIKVYEKALSIEEDEDTRYNLEYLKQQKDQKSQEQNQLEESPQHEQQEPQKENLNSKKSKDKISSKPMDEQEAKKWERALMQKEPVTKPVILYKSNKMENNNNAITW
ncbi:VWA domain-containing protein [Sulfurospirillum diekertiae]|uniref:VWA domain-containing protein n=1 Tax=Sulfurospirillum diekertiae TaxID=1854492 RepID=A0A6G9VTK0_9BACT|nr:VWA domain-containing protein [Sulfurospirillum diekertiae]QIR76255.1 VWA domain-containing protein [Sulfurospirillum diekertiae]QIR78886.1 VWA domain-containing protein [Sulfurospirillum diekertiae]